MAIVSADLITQPRVTNMSGGHRQYVVRYRVITDSVDTSASTVMVSPLLPQRWDNLLVGDSYDYGVWCTGWPNVYLEDENKSRKVWIAESTYSSQGQSQEEQKPDNPLDAPWEIDGDADEWVEEVKIDVNFVPVMNSSRQPFTGKDAERFRTRRRLRLSKNFATVKQSWVDTIEGSTNANAVTITGMTFPANTLLMRKIAFTRRFAGPYVYWPHSFHIDVDKETFKSKIVDRGTKTFTGTDRNNQKHYTEILDDESGNPVQPPGLYLDGAGGLLAVNFGVQPVFANAPDHFQFYEPTDWGQIGFPA